MKKLLFTLLVLVASYSANAQTITLEEARTIYAESMKDKATCEAAFKKFSSVTTTGNNLLTGYKGAVTVAMSKHLKTVKEKLAYFNDGKSLIESAIHQDDKNVELKFIRYTIQSNCPPALKYNKNMGTDKAYIIEHLATVKNSVVRNQIKGYMLKSKDLTETEKQKLNAY